MKKVFILFLVCACILLGCVSNVKNSAKDGFKAYFFYKSGCHACEKVEPTVKNVSEKFNIIFCEIGNMSSDCINVSKKVGLHAVPTMAIVKDGKYEAYVGSNEITDFLRRSHD